ncbi:MAG: hypothetical protein ACRDTD_26310 [Pseudonocardiaceae bacterium]
MIAATGTMPSEVARSMQTGSRQATRCTAAVNVIGARAMTLARATRASDHNLSPSAGLVTRQIRIELPPSEHILAETRDKIIDVVVKQLLDEQQASRLLGEPGDGGSSAHTTPNA